MKLAIISGKGGTGKTSIAVGLFLAMAKSNIPVSLVDLDVEEPNTHLFFKKENQNPKKIPLSFFIPQLDQNLCTHCGACALVCQYHALAVFSNSWMLFPELCHACKRCYDHCPTGALKEKPRVIGQVQKQVLNNGILAEGRMETGNTQTTHVIKETKKQVLEPLYQIWDGPPGTSCPALESVRGANRIWVVTEPSPLGMHDLKLILSALKEEPVVKEVILNKSEKLIPPKIIEICQEFQVPVIAQIPFSKKGAKAYAHGKSLWDIKKNRPIFLNLVKHLKGVFNES